MWPLGMYCHYCIVMICRYILFMSLCHVKLLELDTWWTFCWCNIELQAWDASASGCNLNQQLEVIGSQQPEIKSGTFGETHDLIHVYCLSWSWMFVYLGCCFMYSVPLGPWKYLKVLEFKCCIFWKSLKSPAWNMICWFGKIFIG